MQTSSFNPPNYNEDRTDLAEWDDNEVFKISYPTDQCGVEAFAGCDEQIATSIDEDAPNYNADRDDLVEWQ